MESQNLLFKHGFEHPIYKEYMEEKKMSDSKEWKKVENKIFKFENEGDHIEGILVGKEPSRTFKNQVYKIQTDEGENMTVFGTAVIDSGMIGVAIGDQVKIVYTGSKKNKNKGQNDIKLFDVLVK